MHFESGPDVQDSSDFWCPGAGTIPGTGLTLPTMQVPHRGPKGWDKAPWHFPWNPGGSVFAEESAMSQQAARG